MNDRTRKVREIFDQAAEIESAAGRRTFLDSACAGDADLRGQVDALLQALDDAGSFLGRPALDAVAPATCDQTEAFGSTPAPPPGDATAVEPAASALAPSEALPYLAPPARSGSIGRLGHYEILEVLGKGGFGTVLRAFDEKLHRAVAIKVLAPALAASGSARRRFIREARTAAAVKNEHVVAIHGVQDEAEPPYLVMELIDGISLQDKLDRKGPLAVTDILRIGMQIAEGVAAAHRQGLVHRDIKPANILLENGVERVKVTDFGLARAVDDASMTQSGTVAGTPMYMSPEQAEGLPIDHRSDLFSFGTVLYAMCTGHPPFRASGTHAVLKRVIDAAPRPIREINNEIPDWLCDIIAKLHAKAPADRFQTANEVAERLGQRLADVQAGRAASVSDPGERAKPPLAQACGSPGKRRNRLIAGALGLLIVGLVLGLFGERLYLGLTRQGRIMAQWDDPDVMVLILSKDQDPPTSNVLLAGEWIRLPSGSYSVNAITRSGREIKELTLAQPWLDGGMETTVTNPAGVALGRGDRMMVRAIARTLPANLPVADSKEAGWVPLFGGKDLTGWRVVGEPANSWQIRDGTLWGGGGRTFLVSERKFTNFRLRAELRVGPGCEGMLLCRADPSDTALLTRSFAPARLRLAQAPLLGGISNLDVGLSTDWKAKGGQGFTRPYRASEWVALDLIADGRRLTANVVVTDVQRELSMLDPVEQLQRGKGPIPVVPGPIILHLGTSEGSIEFRKIHVKELPAAQ